MRKEPPRPWTRRSLVCRAAQARLPRRLVAKAQYVTRALLLLGISPVALISCHGPMAVADQCASAYPRPDAVRLAEDTASIPNPNALTLYHAADSLPQIYKVDSSVGWFRDLVYAHFGDFPDGATGVHSFLLRFHARIVGLADTSGWYAVRIPDPGPDTAKFNLLRYCIGADHGVYVRPAYSRSPAILRLR